MSSRFISSRSMQTADALVQIPSDKAATDYPRNGSPRHHCVHDWNRPTARTTLQSICGLVILRMTRDNCKETPNCRILASQHLTAALHAAPTDLARRGHLPQLRLDMCRYQRIGPDSWCCGGDLPCRLALRYPLPGLCSVWVLSKAFLIGRFQGQESTKPIPTATKAPSITP